MDPTWLEKILHGAVCAWRFLHKTDPLLTYPFCAESGRHSAQNPWCPQVPRKKTKLYYVFVWGGPTFTGVLCRIGSSFGTKWVYPQVMDFVNNLSCTKSGTHSHQIHQSTRAQPARFAMTKRKASGAPAAAKSKASKKGDSGLPSIQPDALRLPHLKLFNTWVYLDIIPFLSLSWKSISTLVMFPYIAAIRHDTIYTQKKTMDCFLSELLDKKEPLLLYQILVHFLLFPWRTLPRNSLNGSTRPSQRILVCRVLSWKKKQVPRFFDFRLLRSYATPGDMMGEQVPLNVRPWQLPYRRDFGLRGTGDTDPTLVTRYPCYMNSKWVIASCCDKYGSLNYNQGSPTSPMPAAAFERHADKCQPPRCREGGRLRGPKVLAATGPFGAQSWWAGSSDTARTWKAFYCERLEQVSVLPDCALRLLEMPWTSWGQSMSMYVFSKFKTVRVSCQHFLPMIWSLG